ncbi:hypothetical protein [Micromonospora chokoriensis]|uniref:hypothetical protein n=1 Tax=Micromonospora chokoriensis TaxID=356851 RepID=UPI0004C3F368|nr:hypothetical protein [Micromonospora chokoriensis]
MESLDQPPSRVRWADATVVVAIIFTLILTARQLRPLAEAAAFLARTGETVTVLPSATWPRAAVWVAISLAIVAGWQTAATLGAWSAVLYEIVVAATRISGDRRYDVSLDLLAWPLLLAVAAAVLLSVAAPVGHGLDLLPRRGRWLLAAAAAVTTLTAAATPLLGDYYGPLPADSIDPGFYPAFAISSRLSDAVSGLTFAAVLALTLATAMGIDRAARRRVLTLMGAGAVGIIAIHLGLPRPFGMSAGLLVSGPVQAVLVAL